MSKAKTRRADTTTAPEAEHAKNADADKPRRSNTANAKRKPDSGEETRGRSNASNADALANAVFSKPLERPLVDSSGASLFRRLAPIVSFGIALFVLLSNLSHVSGAVNNVISAMTAVFVGMLIAFVLNVPLRLFEGYILRWIKPAQLRRGISMLFCYVILVGVGAIFALIAIPQIVDSARAMSSRLPEFGADLNAFFNSLVEKYQLDPEIVRRLQPDWNSLASNIVDFVSSSIPEVMSTTRSITSRVTEIFIGLVLSAYMLYDKERLGKQGARLCRAALRSDWSERIISLCSLALTTFKGYISGLFTEALILGMLTAGLMTLFGFPIPALVGMLMAMGALVPIFGIFIMIVTSALLIAAQSGVPTGLWFVAFMITLQQLEGNLIYPRVMGSAIRLPGIWVLIAATVGGMMYGLSGLVLSVPFASMLYSLARAYVISREQRRAAQSQTEG